MADNTLVMGSFGDIDPAVDTMERLRAMDIPDEQISVVSHIPLSARVLGRPHPTSPLQKVALVSAAVGMSIGIFFTVITPYMYIIRVGGQPIVPLPPTLLLLYEFTMLALILGTFGAFLVVNHFPDQRPHHYNPRLNDGQISVLVECPPDRCDDVAAALRDGGAEDVHEPERRMV